MSAQLPEITVGRLERSCKEGRRPLARIRMGAGAAGIERAEAFFRDRAFALHRHDTYAVGVTVSGVQTFTYRGAVRLCLPGRLHVLYPDELHDGAPGTEVGFGYRILYVDPVLMGAALGGRALPFVADPVVAATSAPARRLAAAIRDIDEPLDEVGVSAVVVTLADALSEIAGDRAVARPVVDREAVARVREALMEEAGEAAPMAALEAVAGLDRWALARQFRTAYGTSPHRFRVLRRLGRARRLIASGVTLAAAAAAAGFADQSHMTRQFKGTYGLTPARWQAAIMAEKVA